MHHFPKHPDEVKEVFWGIQRHIKVRGTRSAPGRRGENMSYYEVRIADGEYVPHYEYFTPEKVAEIKKGAEKTADG